MIAAKYGKKLLALILLELQNPSILILDSARFHKKDDVRHLAEQAGHVVLFLPPYSPDFNPIEQDFVTIKKIRAYAPSGTTLDSIIQAYGN